jgi:hypothetical protein
VATQLGLYNGALLICRERFLTALTDPGEPCRLLNYVWSENGVNACLEMAQWNFAMRTISIIPDPSIQPSFGYVYVYDKPADWVLTSAVSEEPYFRVPLTRYFDEAGYWYADLQTIYVRYVSNDPTYGGNLGAWPESFDEMVKAYFAWRIIGKLTKDENEQARVERIFKAAKLHAKSRSAMAEPTSFVAQGAWSRARQRFLNRRDGGSIGNLIG